MGLRRPGQVRKVGGQLELASAETAQDLAQEIGAPPITSPLMGAALGATPDQAKMLGTPNNLRAAIRAQTGTETLARAERITRPEVAVTEEQARQKAELDRYTAAIPALGKLDTALAQQVMRTLTPGQPAEFIGIDWDAVSSYLGGSIAANNVLRRIGEDRRNEAGVLTESPLTKFLKGLPVSEKEKQDVEAAFEELKGLGFDLTTDTLKNNFLMSPEDRLIQRIADSKASELRLGSISNDALRAANILPKDATEDDANIYWGQIATALGVKPAAGQTAKEALSNYTFENVKQAVGQLQASFADLRELRRITADPLASATQRREANKRLRELGYRGYYAAEEKINDLEKQIEDGDTLRIGNQVFEVESIIEDDEFMEVFREAMSDPRSMKALEKQNPELAKWLTDNKQALDRQLEAISGRLAPGTDVRRMFETQAVVSELASTYNVSEEDMSRAISGLGFSVADGKLTLTATQTQQVATAALKEAVLRKTGTNRDVVMAGLATGLSELDAREVFNSIVLAEGETWDTLSEPRREQLITQGIDSRQRASFEASGYKAQYDALVAEAKEFGVQLPPEVKDLTAAEWYAMSPRPDLTSVAQAVRQATAKKRVAADNVAKLTTYDTYGDAVKTWLAGGSDAYAKAKAGDAALDFGTRVALLDSWTALGRTPAEKLQLAKAVASLGDDALRQRADAITPLLAKNRAGVLVALEKSPKEVFAQLDGAAAMDRAYSAALGAKNAQGAWEVLFGKNNPTTQQLVDLYAQYAGNKLMVKDRDGKNVSAFPVEFDSNRDGVLDSYTDVIKRLSAQTRDALTNVKFVTAAGSLAAKDGAVSVTDARDKLLGKLAQAVSDAGVAKENKDIQTAWTSNNFGAQYTSLFTNTGVSEAAVLRMLGVKSLSPKDFYNAGKAAQGKFREQVAAIKARIDSWNKSMAPATKGVDKKVLDLAARMYGPLGTIEQYVEDKLPAWLTSEIRGAERQPTIEMRISSAVSNAKKMSDTLNNKNFSNEFRDQLKKTVDKLISDKKSGDAIRLVDTVNARPADTEEFGPWRSGGAGSTVQSRTVHRISHEFDWKALSWKRTRNWVRTETRNAPKENRFGVRY